MPPYVTDMRVSSTVNGITRVPPRLAVSARVGTVPGFRLPHRRAFGPRFTAVTVVLDLQLPGPSVRGLVVTIGCCICGRVKTHGRPGPEPDRQARCPFAAMFTGVWNVTFIGCPCPNVPPGSGEEPITFGGPWHVGYAW